jgi:hypothetical protein
LSAAPSIAATPRASSAVDRRLSDLSLEGFMSPRPGFEDGPIPVQ